VIKIGNCVVCDGRTSGSLEFCKVCYDAHKADVKSKRPWVRILKNDAQRERRRREREFEDTSLDMILDNQYERRY